MELPCPKTTKSQCLQCYDSHLQAQHIVRNATMVIYSRLLVLRKRVGDQILDDSCMSEIKTRLQDIEGALDLMSVGRV